jgi:hypothetical protein
VVSRQLHGLLSTSGHDSPIKNLVICSAYIRGKIPVTFLENFPLFVKRTPLNGIPTEFWIIAASYQALNRIVIEFWKICSSFMSLDEIEVEFV